MNPIFIYTILLSTILGSYAMGAAIEKFDETSPLLSHQYTSQNQEELPAISSSIIVLSTKELKLKKHHYKQAFANLSIKNSQHITFNNSDLIEQTINSLNIAARLGSASSKRILIHLLAQNSLPVGTPFITQYNNTLPSPSFAAWQEQVEILKTKDGRYMPFSNYLLSTLGCGLVYDLLINVLQGNNTQQLAEFKEVFEKKRTQNLLCWDLSMYLIHLLIMALQSK